MIIERPNLNKADPMANIAMIDTWIARTADALNYEWQQLQKELAALAEEKESTEQTSSEIPADAVTRAEFVAALANKADAAALANKADVSDLNAKVDKVAGKGLSTNDYTDADVAALAGKADQADLVSGLAGKVDAEEGKGLSTEDYTTAEKTKLAGITAGAEPNVQSDWTASSTSDAYIRNKPTIPSASSATPLANGTAAAGSSADYSRADHVHPRDSFDADEISYQIGSSSEIPVSQALDELYDAVGGRTPSTTTPSMDGIAAVGTENAYARGDHVHPAEMKYTSGTHDLNDYTAPGLYFFTSACTLSNQPNSAVNGWLEVITDQVSTVKQYWHRLGSDPTYKDEYFRLRTSSGTWSSWERILTESDISKASSSASSRRTQVTKLPDGTMIVGIWAKVTAAVTTRWTNLYYGQVSLDSWPEAFVAEPFVTATISAHSGTSDALISLSGVTASSCGNAYIYRPASTSSATYEVNLTAIGRWK